MLSFDNTEIAFRNKSDKGLQRAHYLFKIIGNPILTKFGKSATNFALKIGLPIKGIIKKTIFRQFCGGETIQECRPTIQSLGEYRIGTILDYSIEGKTEDKDFANTVAEIISTIKEGELNPHIPFAVFKVTGISRFALLEKANSDENLLDPSEKKEFQLLEDRILSICQAASDCAVPVFIDAEESWIQDVIDRLAHKMMRKFNSSTAIVYNTIQMYRHDRLSFLKEQISIAESEHYVYGVKLVRGAYMEKERRRAIDLSYPSPIQKDKLSTDSDYNEALSVCLEKLEYTALVAGTHNEHSSALLAQLIEEKGLTANHPNLYFAQLLGMSDHISYNLADAGYNVAKYVPYGPVKEVMPYLLRRADENTSVAGQTSRELSLISREVARRKASK